MSCLLILASLSQLYNSSSYLDDLMLAAAWLAQTTGKQFYVSDAEAYWERIQQGRETSWQSFIYDWDNQWWPGNLLLWQLTGNRRYQVPLHFVFLRSNHLHVMAYSV
jgi:hypothetical protein